MCGCGGSKAVSAVANIPAARPTTMEAATSAVYAAKLTTAAAAAAKATTVAPGYRDAGADDEAEQDASTEGAPSVDALLQELRDLEQGVRALGVRERDDDEGSAPRTARPRHRRRPTDWGGGGGGERRRLAAESVAVVTESADPLRDFRRSMVQMVAENGITGGAELRGLLRRFLSLNAPRHHHLILRAFADVWEDLFAAGGRAPPPPPPPAQVSYYGYRASKRQPYRRDDTSRTTTPVV